MCCYSSICRWGCPSREVNSRMRQSPCRHQRLPAAQPPLSSPKCDFGWSGDYRGSLRVPGALAGPGIWRRCSEMGSEAGEGGLSRRWAHPDRPDSGILCRPRGANWVAHLPAASGRWGAHPKIVIIPNAYMLFRTQIKTKTKTRN